MRKYTETGYTVKKALELARSLKYGPLPRSSDPTPDAAEALVLIREEQRTCGFNWLTGAVAIDQVEFSERGDANAR